MPPPLLRRHDATRCWDGALGTELIALGPGLALDLATEAAEHLSLRAPEAVRDLHARYLAAGAEVIQTNTFGASRPRLALTGLDAQLVRLNSVAVELARAAGARIVVASLGPTGLDPCAPEAAAEIERAYADQVAALTDAGVDGLHFETQYHGVEARAAIRAARRVAPSLPLIVSFTVALGDHGYQTPLGVTLADMADAILDAEPDAVGLNCSLEARKMLGPLRALRARTELPILVQPQAGQPSVGCRGDHRGDSPERFARDALALVFAGADAVGGCCGASPAHIAALATALAEVG